MSQNADPDGRAARPYLAIRGGVPKLEDPFRVLKPLSHCHEYLVQRKV
jgi:hypothetical protein